MSNETTRKLDFVEKVQVHIAELRIGMYVCELDRPWLETPFLFQGFEVKSEVDIDALAKYCQFVYIDKQKSRVIQLEPTPAQTRYYRSSGKAPPKKELSFGQEIGNASTAKQETSGLIRTFMDDIKFGNSIDTQLAKAAVSECVSSVMRNPDALMFLTQLRNKDEYTSQHSFNVCVFSIVLGRHLGMSAEELEVIGTCGLLHDMGKVIVPLEILHKEGQLNEEEFEIMKQHTSYGREILMSGRNIFTGTVDVAYGHHEHLDGTGYPRGLQAHQLSQSTKIVSVVDKYDAITADRVYQKGRSHMDAMNLLNKLATRGQVDSSLAMGFISALGVFPPGSIVELTSGEVAIVIGKNPEKRLRPQIVVVRDAQKRAIPARFVDLAERETDHLGRPYKIIAMHRGSEFGIDISQYQSLITHTVG